MAWIGPAIAAGSSLLSSSSSKKGAKSAARAANDNIADRLALVQGLNSPAHFQQQAREYNQILRPQHELARAAGAEVSALSNQRDKQEIRQASARSKMPTSGYKQAALGASNAAHSQRLTDLARKSKIDLVRDVLGLTERGVIRGLSAASNTPMPIPIASNTAYNLGTLGNVGSNLSAYWAYTGTGPWQKKEQVRTDYSDIPGGPRSEYVPYFA